MVVFWLPNSKTHGYIFFVALSVLQLRIKKTAKSVLRRCSVKNALNNADTNHRIFDCLFMYVPENKMRI